MSQVRVGLLEAPGWVFQSDCKPGFSPGGGVIRSLVTGLLRLLARCGAAFVQG